MFNISIHHKVTRLKKKKRKIENGNKVRFSFQLYKEKGQTGLNRFCNFHEVEKKYDIVMFGNPELLSKTFSIKVNPDRLHISIILINTLIMFRALK